MNKFYCINVFLFAELVLIIGISFVLIDLFERVFCFLIMPWYQKESLVKFQSPSTITLISPSNGGKTTFVYRLLQHSNGMFTERVSKILYCYGSAWQKMFDEMQEKIPNITFKEGLPSSEDLQELTSEGRHSCLILLHKLQVIRKLSNYGLFIRTI